MIDKFGYRANVGIILINKFGKVLWARRYGEDSWQFPQGGIDSKETPEIAMFRELEEEVGLLPSHVEVLGQTKGWLKYRLPKKFLSKNKTPFKGQKQKWFLLQLNARDDAVRLDLHAKPEFDDWQWVSYYYPIGAVVDFKQDVYRRALVELAQYLPSSLRSAEASVNQAHTG